MNALQTIPIGQARAGMRLAGDLRDGAGRLLLPCGTVLTDCHIAALARRGVERLEVAAAHMQTEADGPRRGAEITQRIAYLFRGSVASPVMQDLQRAILEHRLERGS